MIVRIDINFTIYLVKHDLGQRTRDTATGASTQAQPARERTSEPPPLGWMASHRRDDAARARTTHGMVRDVIGHDGQADSGTDGHQWTDTRHGSRAPFSNHDPLRHETEEKEERARTFPAQFSCAVDVHSHSDFI